MRLFFLFVVKHSQVFYFVAFSGDFQVVHPIDLSRTPSRDDNKKNEDVRELQATFRDISLRTGAESRPYRTHETKELLMKCSSEIVTTVCVFVCDDRTGTYSTLLLISLIQDVSAHCLLQLGHRPVFII